MQHNQVGALEKAYLGINRDQKSKLNKSFFIFTPRKLESQILPTFNPSILHLPTPIWPCSINTKPECLLNEIHLNLSWQVAKALNNSIKKFWLPRVRQILRPVFSPLLKFGCSAFVHQKY